MRIRKIKAVFIDMDGTLVRLPPDFCEAAFLQQVLRKLGHEIELERTVQVYKEAEAWWQEWFADDYTPVYHPIEPEEAWNLRLLPIPDQPAGGERPAGEA